MRKINLMLPALIFAAVVGLTQIGVGSAFAAPQYGRQQHQTGQMGQTRSKTKTVKKFQGTIEMKDGQYELDAGGATYRLTSQATAKRFKGKNVTVLGILNTSTGTIEVLSIKAG